MGNDMNNVENASRRKLLKKAYQAPAMVALGSMLTTNDAHAGWFSHRHYSGCGHDSGGSSSSLSGGTCSRCGYFSCRCR